MDLASLASKGRNGDTEIRKIDGKLAHVNKYEASLIDSKGKLGERIVKTIGSGTINPSTGLKEYDHAWWHVGPIGDVLSWAGQETGLDLDPWSEDNSYGQWVNSFTDVTGIDWLQENWRNLGWNEAEYLYDQIFNEGVNPNDSVYGPPVTAEQKAELMRGPWLAGKTETMVPEGTEGAPGTVELSELTESLDPSTWMEEYTERGGATGEWSELASRSGEFQALEQYTGSPFVTGYGGPEGAVPSAMEALMGPDIPEFKPAETTSGELMEQAWGQLNVPIAARSYGPTPADWDAWDISGELSNYWPDVELAYAGEQLRGATESMLEPSGPLATEVVDPYELAKSEASRAFVAGQDPSDPSFQYGSEYATAEAAETGLLGDIGEARATSARETEDIHRRMMELGVLGTPGSLQAAFEGDITGLEQQAETAVGGPGGYLATMVQEAEGWEEKEAGWLEKLEGEESGFEKRMKQIKKEAGTGAVTASQGLLGERLSELASSYARGGAEFGSPMSLGEAEIRRKRGEDIKSFAEQRGVAREDFTDILDYYGFEETDDLDTYPEGLKPILTDPNDPESYVPGSQIELAWGAKEAAESGALTAATTALTTGGFELDPQYSSLEHLFEQLGSDYTAEEIAGAVTPTGYEGGVYGDATGDVAQRLLEYEQAVAEGYGGLSAEMQAYGGYWDPVEGFVEYSEDWTSPSPAPGEYSDPITGATSYYNIGIPVGDEGWSTTNIGAAQGALSTSQVDLFGTGTLADPEGGALGFAEQQYGHWDPTGGDWTTAVLDPYQEGAAQTSARESLGGVGGAWENMLANFTALGSGGGEGSLTSKWGDVFGTGIGTWYPGWSDLWTSGLGTKGADWTS